jgi:hypothetical protein
MPIWAIAAATWEKADDWMSRRIHKFPLPLENIAIE